MATSSSLCSVNVVVVEPCMKGYRRIPLHRTPIFDECIIHDIGIQLRNKKELVHLILAEEEPHPLYIHFKEHFPEAKTFRIHHKLRYKTSDASGDEWRTSLVLLVDEKEYQGHIPENNGDITWEFGQLNKGYFKDVVIPEYIPGRFDIYCDQIGCTERVDDKIGNNKRSIYKLKQGYKIGCAEKIDLHWGYDTPPVRVFCSLHSGRGDCGREDADNNYDVIERAPFDQKVQDRIGEVLSPSLFGGVVFLN